MTCYDPFAISWRPYKMKTKTQPFLLAIVPALLLFLHATTCYGGGITIITHGFSWDSANPQQWINDYANAVASRTTNPTAVAVYQIDFVHRHVGDVRINEIGSVSWLSGPTDAFSQSSNCEIIFKVNWSQCAAQREVGEAVSSTTIAQLLVDYFVNTRISSHAWIEQPIHLIGHSRGASVCAEMARIFGYYGIWVDQQTTLDPHPVNNDGNVDSVATVDGTVVTYENTLFSDNYYENTYAGTIAATYPAGRRIDSAFNRYLNDALIYDGLPNNPLPAGLADDHARVYDWYYGSINLSATALLSDPVQSIPRSVWYTTGDNSGDNCGYKYSRIVGGTRPGDGLHTMFGGDRSGQAVIQRNPAIGSQWPNVFALQAVDSRFTSQTIPQFQIGETLTLQFQYQSYGNQAFATLYRDSDQNPYNGNSVDILGSLIDCPATGGNTILAKTKQWSTTGLAQGYYYLYVKIEDGFGHVRYVYASKKIQIVPLGAFLFVDASRPDDSGSGMNWATAKKPFRRH
jgi:hypothetical protein